MSKQFKYTTVLSIAGSDSGGGAGIQADLKTFSALGCYGTSAITAVTMQNTLGVTGIHRIPVDIVRGQIKAVLDDIKPEAIKIGMVNSGELTTAIAVILKDYPDIPVIFDPVMVSTSGHQLIETGTIATLQQQLFPIATLITPNVGEAELLAQIKIGNIEDMKQAARRIINDGCKAVLIKGGHIKGANLFDIYLDSNNVEKVFKTDFILTNNTHGTGCTLSSAIASFIALGNDMITAIEKAKDYVHQAIFYGRDVIIGEGHGPLNHFFKPQKTIKIEME